MTGELQRLQRADAALLESGLEYREIRVEAPVEPHQQAYVRGGQAFACRLGLRQVQVDRLFAKHRFAALDGPQALLYMHGCRARQDDARNRGITPHALRFDPRGATFRGQTLGLRGEGIDDEFQAQRRVRGDIAGMDAAHTTGAKQCYIEHGYRYLPVPITIEQPREQTVDELRAGEETVAVTEAASAARAKVLAISDSLVDLRPNLSCGTTRAEQPPS